MNYMLQKAMKIAYYYEDNKLRLCDRNVALSIT